LLLIVAQILSRFSKPETVRLAAQTRFCMSDNTRFRAKLGGASNIRSGNNTGAYARLCPQARLFQKGLAGGGDGAFGRVGIFTPHKAVSPLRSATAAQSFAGNRLVVGMARGLFRFNATGRELTDYLTRWQSQR